MTQPPVIINTADRLRDLVKKVEAEPLLACDLEGDSLHHYQEKVCLLQFATPTDSFIVDPLNIENMDPLAPVMADPGVRKVFHGADYDIRSLHRDFRIEVNNLFDTMIACQLLGEKEVGLAAVLKKRFGVELDKKYQKADWSKRPLSRGMIDYASRDTSLLIELYRQLHDELRAKKRLSWMEEECELLSRVRPVLRQAGPLFTRFKGAARMDPRTLAILEELLTLREDKARLRDVPPFKIFGNEHARIIAEKKPRRLAELKDLGGVPSAIIERYGKEMMAAIERAIAVPSDALPHFPRAVRQERSPAQEQRLKNLKQWRDEKAREVGIDAGVLANNALLESLAEAAPRTEEGLAAIPQLKRWQRREFAAELVAVVGKF